MNLPATAENFPLHFAPSAGDCHAQLARMAPWCQHRQDYEMTVYSHGCREWQVLRVCTPCCATLRSGPWEIGHVRNLDR